MAQCPSLNTQSCIKGLLVEPDFCFWAVWAAGLLHKKKLSADYEHLLRAFFHVFGVKKTFLNFFDPENMKEMPSKGAHNLPPTFYLSTGPAAQATQKQISHTNKSPLMQDWVFRLGLRDIYKACWEECH